MANIHLIMQAKGGIGKSYIASLIAQYLKPTTGDLTCFDTDPLNKTFASFGGLKVQQIEITSGDRIKSELIEAFAERLLSLKPKEDVVVDFGASCILEVIDYFATSTAIELMTEHGHNVVIHTIIVGGQAAQHTRASAQNIIEEFPTAKHVLWRNEFFGDVNPADRVIEDTDFFEGIKANLSGQVLLPAPNHELLRNDLLQNFEKGRTFVEALDEKEGVKPIAKKRLDNYWVGMCRAIFEALGNPVECEPSGDELANV